MRIGYGYDVHRLAEGRALIVGGVDIPHDRGLLGHSDADVLTHAVIDALLGALALGDIGQHFPPGAARWKDADSIGLLCGTMALVRDAGYRLQNLDATIVAEEPRLGEYIPRMRLRLAEAMEASVSQISVKATTEEGLGFCGRKEGIAAHAVCLLEAVD